MDNRAEAQAGPDATDSSLRRWAPRRRDAIPSRWRREESRPAGSTARQIVVFTDPDTLRGEGAADLAATRRALSTLAQRGVAVVLWGNETRAQLELIQEDLQVQCPFVAENGGGLFVPVGYFPDSPETAPRIGSYHVFQFARPYQQVTDILRDTAAQLDIDVVGFGDMSVQEVADDCGLSLSQARLAKLREYNEPFRLVKSDPAVRSRLFNALRRAGLRCFSHEGYHHVTGVVDKTASVRATTTLYRRAWQDVVTFGLASHPAETCLLQAVDIPVVVLSAAVDQTGLLRKVPTARLVTARGPELSAAIWQLVNSAAPA